MKKAMIILSVLFLYFHCYAQKFIEQTKVWTVIEKGDGLDGSATISSVYYKFFGDTIVGNKTYAKLYLSTKVDQSVWKFSSLWREDEPGKIFCKYNNSDEELLYDFNLTVGDTFKSSRVPADAIVDSVLIKPFGSVNKKYLFLHLIDVPAHTLTWVDGVGSLFDPNIPDDFWVTGGTSKLICFEENGVLVYHNPEYNACFYTSSTIINDPIGEFKVYPNPVSDELVIQPNHALVEGFNLELYSIKGELIKTECLDSGSNIYRVDVSSIKSGMYILHMVSASGKYVEEVIIKK